MKRDFALSRRQALLGLGAVSLASLPALAAATPDEIVMTSRVIEVNGQAAKVFALAASRGGFGHVMTAGEAFRLRLVNRIDEPSLIHWHGLTPPNAQDGVPDISQPLLAPGESSDYDFPVALPGTHWMHSHFGLQEQRLLAAPLIVRDPAEIGRDEAEIVIMLHDFTFRDPAEIMAGLGHGMNMDMSGMDHSAHAMPGAAGGMNGMSDFNDVEYDAYLANDRTLDDPEIHRLKVGSRLRLRIINGASATNFMIDLGRLAGELIAVDGRPIAPLSASRFPLAIAQRADIRLVLGEGAAPILFQREGARQRTGIILVGGEARVAKIDPLADGPAPAIADLPGRILRAAEPLTARPVDRRLRFALTGSMMDYRWGIEKLADSDAPEAIRIGERVEIEIVNRSPMSHPIHLHGHHFQIVAIDNRRIAGAVRDTESIPVGGQCVLAFDADNPGRWLLHCHNLYHMQAGMMTELVYAG